MLKRSSSNARFPASAPARRCNVRDRAPVQGGLDRRGVGSRGRVLPSRRQDYWCTAPTRGAIREHAARSGFPANRIAENPPRARTRLWPRPDFRPDRVRPTRLSTPHPTRPRRGEPGKLPAVRGGSGRTRSRYPATKRSAT